MKMGLNLSGIPSSFSFQATYSPVPGNPSNSKISNTALAVLRCPDDLTALEGQGNLSYDAHMVPALWTATPYGWSPSFIDGQGHIACTPDDQLLGGSGQGGSWGFNVTIMNALGLMLREDQGPYGTTTPMPWNRQNTPASIADGSPETLMLIENFLVGASGPNGYNAGLGSNWASPLPNFCGFMYPLAPNCNLASLVHGASNDLD